MQSLGLNGEDLPSLITAEQLSPSQISSGQARRKSRVSGERSAPHSSAERGDRAKHLPAACSCSQICYDLSRWQEGMSMGLESKRGCGTVGCLVGCPVGVGGCVQQKIAFWYLLSHAEITEG